MALSKKIETTLNEQINAEFNSSYLYLAMAAYFEDLNLKGMAKWMKMQSSEELKHGLKLFDYTIDRKGRVVLSKIDTPKKEWKNFVSVFEDVLAHEQYITTKINKFMDIAISEKDHATASMLKWFVDEQVEEENNAQELVDKLKILGEHGDALYLLDRELMGRVYVPAVINTK